MVIFALFIFLSAFIVVFAKEIGDSSKSFWSSPHFRNLGLLFFISLFAIRYQYPLYQLLMLILYYWKLCVWFVFKLLNRFDGAEDFAMLLFLFIFTYIPVFLVHAFYFILKRKTLPHKRTYVWFFWSFLMTLLLLT